MTNRLNRRAEEFDRALTAEGPHVDPAIAALVAVAGALAAVPQMRAPFKDALRTQLMSEAATIAASGVPAAVGAATGGAGHVGSLAKVFAKPAMQVATGGLAVTVAAAGIGVGASRSLPGDALYGVKRVIENLQDGFAGGAVAEADSVLEHAQTRLDEVRALLDRDGAVGDIEDTLDDLKAELDEATAQLLEHARAGSKAAYDTLKAQIAGIQAELSALREQLPADAQDELDAAMGTVNTTLAILGTLPPPGGIVPGGPTRTPDVTKSPDAPKTTPPTSPTQTTPPPPPPTTLLPPPPTSVPPVEPSITVPPLPTGTPTLPISLPPIVP